MKMPGINSKNSIRLQRTIYVVSDYLATSVAWFVFNFIRYTQMVATEGSESIPFAQFYQFEQVLLGQILFPLMMMGLYWLSGYYNNPFFRSRLDELLTTISTAVIGSVLIYFMAIVDDPIPDKASNIELLLMLIGLLFGLVYIARFTITRYGLRKIRKGSLVIPMAIVGTSSQARKLRRRLESTRGRGHKIIAFISPDTDSCQSSGPATIDGLPVIPLAELPDFSRDNPLRAILISNEIAQSNNDFSALLNNLYPLNTALLISPHSLQLVGGYQKVGDIAGEPLVDICSVKMAESTRNLKRTGDVVVSAIAMLLLSPVFLLLSLLIKLDSPGPVFYRQERIGYHKKKFNIIKFRTMRNDAEKLGPALSSANDARITRLGRFLRKYRLDEIPQFWNVIRGDMSLVGPRPEREFYISQILKKAPFYTLLHQVRPGLTSWGMVKHGYASSVDEMVARARYDLLYLDNISLIVDLKILLYTVNTVVNGRGV